MASILPGYEYDIFISYRQNDNRSGWVTEFVTALQEELAATLKEPVSVYFDSNPNNGLLETHNVDKSLREKLRCLIFIPIISQTYCDTKSYAWQHEFCVFNKLARADVLGVDLRLDNGNYASRILPVKIHDLDRQDEALIVKELGTVLRAIEFIFKSPGVNRPLTRFDNPDKNQNQTSYRDQVNKAANAIKEIIGSCVNTVTLTANTPPEESPVSRTIKLSFGKKFKRRNVLRASLVYLLTALVIWKFVDISSDLLNLSKSVTQLLTLILIVLFPPAVLLAWLYERSPRGFIRTGSAASSGNPYTDEQKKPFTSNTFITLLLVTTVSLFLLFPRSDRTQTSSSVSKVERSIAVLPFDNLSNDPEQELFGDGMMQEILDHLFKIGGLKIPSGRSSMRYKGSKLSVREIAKELDVSYVVEGNISRSGDNVRIIVRLINGKNGQTLWTHNYNQTWNAVNLLDIQSDVARQVAENMELVISPEVKKRIEATPTTNTEAYILFLEASQTGIELKYGQQLLEKAISLDPGFADAYALLAFYYLIQGNDNFGDLNREQVLTKSEPLLKKALQLDKNSVMAHTYLAFIELWYYWDFESVEKEFQIVTHLNPSSPDVYSEFIQYLIIIGKFEKALIMSKKYFDYADITENKYISRALAYCYSGQQEKALETVENYLHIFQKNNYILYNSVRIYINLEKYEKAIELFEKNLADKPANELSNCLLGWVGIAYHKTGNKSKYTEFLNELTSINRKPFVGSPYYFTAAVYAVTDEKEKALHFLQKSYTDHELDMTWVKVDPLFQSLHGDPRFENLLIKMGFK